MAQEEEGEPGRGRTMILALLAGSSHLHLSLAKDDLGVSQLRAAFELTMKNQVQKKFEAIAGCVARATVRPGAAPSHPTVFIASLSRPPPRLLLSLLDLASLSLKRSSGA